jgi:DNA polymerase-3 subunit epsilon
MSNVIKGPWSLLTSASKKLVTSSSDIEYVVLDTENTGTMKADRIVEIALVAFKGTEVIEEWSTLVNPQRDVGKTNIHGITASMVSSAPIFLDVINDIFRIINNRVLVAHNLGFDARMLIQEFNRAKTQGDIGKGFCTMSAARRLLPPEKSSLTDACSEFGIKIIDAHSALGDCKMTMELFNQLSEDEQEVSPAMVDYSSDMNPARVLVRTAFNNKIDDALERIQAFTKKVPFPTSDEKFIAYLLLLNMAMQDLIISSEEESELNKWAEDLGVSQKDVKKLHTGYLDSFIQAALRDGVITLQEREMIEKVGSALHLPVVIPETAQPIKANSDNLNVGKKVCFTGAAIGFNGEQISREDLEALAAKVGLHPVNDVTKKGCDVLVAADESSMSGKAKKAKDWGIPVISVEKFITFCTFG